MTSPRDIAASYWRVEAARDLDAVMNHYAADATFIAPGWAAQGQDEIREFYVQQFAAYPGLEVEIVRDLTSGSRAALEWEAVLIDHDGRRQPLNGINIIDTHEGRFTEVHAYFDTAVVSAMRGTD